MLRVRYPNGLTIQYNTANCLTPDVHGWNLYTGKGGDWVASIQPSAGAIVEAVEACRVYQAADDPSGEKFDAALDAIEQIRAKIAKLSTAERKRRKG